ncbi:MAG: CapA family protein [Deltaproteobacteria bacterium]|nr:CapA family protein [Deltaproteobacteria bacterium]
MSVNGAQTVIIHAVGDTSPRRIEYGEPVESLFTMVADKIKEADIALCQLERTFSTKGALQYRAQSTWHSRVHPDNVKSLVYAGFHLVTNASNHTYDYGPESLLESIEVLRAHGIEVIGVGSNLEEARRAAILERKGTKVAFLDYNSVLPDEYEAREDKPGCAPIKVATYYEAQEYQAGTPPRVITIPREDDVLAMEEDITRAREKADVVVVSFHWGIHHIPGMLADYQFTVGHRAIDAGADIIFGTHAHLVKGIEIYKGKTIFYSLGNFAEESPHHLPPPPGTVSTRSSPKYGYSIHEPGARYNKQRDKRYTLMVRCLITGKKIQKISFLPGWINDVAEPRFVAHGEPEFQEVVEYVEKWSRELGTELTVQGDEVVVYSQSKQ